MIAIYLILFVWICYAVWFSYALTKEHESDDRQWWHPFFYFVVGLFAAIMIVVGFIEESMGQAARILHERAIRKRDAKREAKNENK